MIGCISRDYTGILEKKMDTTIMGNIGIIGNMRYISIIPKV